MAKAEKKRTPLLWLLIIFVAIIAYMIINNYKSMCIHELFTPSDGIKKLLTVGDNIVVISRTQLYAWDWNSLPGRVKVDSITTPMTTALSCDNIIKILGANKQLTLRKFKDSKQPKPLYPFMTGKCINIETSLNAKYAAVAYSEFNESKQKIQLSIIFPNQDSVLPVITKKLDDHGQLHDITVSNDGKLLAVVGQQESGWIFVADVPSKKILWQQTIPDSTKLENVTFSPDGQLLYASKSDRFVCIFKAADGKLVKQLEIDKYKTPPNNPQSISCITVSPNNKILAVSTVPASRVWLWDVKTWEKIMVLSPRQFTVIGMAFSPDSLFLATGDLIGKNPMKIWRLPESH